MSCAVCLNVRLQHMNITNTYTDKHACRDLRAAAWVILSLDVGTEHFGKGGLREVYVRFGYTFSFCLHCVLLIETTRWAGFADACAQTCDRQTRRTHVCVCWRCVYRCLLLESTPLIDWHSLRLLLPPPRHGHTSVFWYIWCLRWNYVQDEQ